MPQLEVLGACAPARATVFGAMARAFAPRAQLSVSAWAAANRIVSAESGSRHPGPWRNERAPHLVEIMDALGPADPAEDVVVVASAQVGKTEVGINWFGYIVAAQPGPMILVLPSHDESKKYVRTKLQPAIDETPALRRAVLEVTDRSERGSTAAFKKFRGGFAQITFAGSSKGLQMLTAQYTIGDEVSEWPAEAGERGDPVGQLKKRTETYERDRKRLWVSTPSILGACRITNDFEASDKRRRYVPCPHCGAFQALSFDRLRWDSEAWPHRAWFECAAQGCVIEHLDKPAMMAAGVWIATAMREGEDGPGEWFAPDDLARWQGRVHPSRIRGFHVWKAYSLFSTWDSIVAEHLDAKGRPEKERVFIQQVLGEAYEDKGDAPDAELLHKQRLIGWSRGAPPVGPLVYTGATDVQGNRLEWAVWGWSEGMTRWLVDWGVIEGDPHDLETWAEHDRMITTRSYSAGGSTPQGVEAWAVDSGFASQHVYNYSRGRGGIFAVDGRAKRIEPFIGQPKRVDVKLNGKRIAGGAMIWPVGTFALKSDLYAAIRKTIAGPDGDGAMAPGAMILPGDMPLAYAEQLTSEHLERVESRSGVSVQRWVKLAGRANEALDIAGYARALAYHLRLDQMRPDAWAALRAERGAPAPDAATRQPDLFAVEIRPTAPAKAEAKTAPRAAAAKTPRGSGDDWLGSGREDIWT
jgi:phage terminase large subunit GpA-like protein